VATTNSQNLQGDALTAQAAKLGVDVEEFRGADGAINELDLRRRVRMVERYASEFHFGKVLLVCMAAFGICGVATWVAIHFLWHPY
jgi:hypothetical protein